MNTGPGAWLRNYVAKQYGEGSITDADLKEAMSCLNDSQMTLTGPEFDFEDL